MSGVSLRPAHTFSLRMLRAVQSELAPFKQRDLAAEMGVSPARISQIMGGRESNLTIGTIEHLLMAVDRLAAKELT